MKKHLLTLFAILVLATQAYCQSNWYYSDLSENENVLIICILFFVLIAAFFTLMHIFKLAGKAQEHKKTDKNNVLPIIIGSFLLFSQQAVAQNSTVVETLKNNWILILSIIGVLVVIIFLVTLGLCYVVKAMNESVD